MIYLNNAATSFPKPQNVIDAIGTYLNSVPFHSSRVGFEMQGEDVIFSCRNKLAQLFNVQDPANIIFTSGATESLNLALFGFRPDGKHVVTTSIEHNSVLRPLKALERDGKIELSIAECSETGLVAPESIAREVKDTTGAIVVSHCSNVTGAILDLKKISAIAHDNEAIFIVDAAQSAGCIPIDVEEMDVDILAFTGHKSLFGLPGIGGLYINPKYKLTPLKVGGTGIRSELLYQPETIPLYYEAGTPNVPGIVSLNAGIDFITETGIDKIKKKKERHFIKITEGLEDVYDDLIIYGGFDITERIPLFCFNIRDIDPEDVGYILENSFHIIIRSGLHCAPLIHKALGSYPKGSVRVSPSYFTTDKDIEDFIDAVKQICIRRGAL